MCDAIWVDSSHHTGNLFIWVHGGKLYYPRPNENGINSLSVSDVVIDIYWYFATICNFY